MLENSALEKHDPSGFHKIYNRWAQIAKEAYDSDLEPVDFKNIDHIVFAGMGGSGTIGDLFSSILSKSNIHVNVVKGYLLPKTVDSNTLVVTTSISGNTVETLKALDSAKKLDCKIIAFSSGGKMGSFCSKNEIEFRSIPELHSPRASFPNYVYSILKVLNSNLPLEKHDITESLKEMKNLSLKISSSNLNKTNPSLQLANWIKGIPLIYYPSGLQAAAIRFKNSLQENVKSHAIIENVIEACHNNIVSWERPSSMIPIMLEGEDDYVSTKERWKILKEYFEENNIDYREIFSVKGGILSKIVNLVYLLDYATIFRAVLSGVDPTPIKSIDYVKSKL